MNTEDLWSRVSRPAAEGFLQDGTRAQRKEHATLQNKGYLWIALSSTQYEVMLHSTEARKEARDL